MYWHHVANLLDWFEFCTAISLLCTEWLQNLATATVTLKELTIVLRLLCTHTVVGCKICLIVSAVVAERNHSLAEICKLNETLKYDQDNSHLNQPLIEFLSDIELTCNSILSCSISYLELFQLNYCTAKIWLMKVEKISWQVAFL